MYVSGAAADAAAAAAAALDEEEEEEAAEEDATPIAVRTEALGASSPAKPTLVVCDPRSMIAADDIVASVWCVCAGGCDGRYNRSDEMRPMAQSSKVAIFLIY